MQTYRVETTVTNEGRVLLEQLPFQPGEAVEVVVRGLAPAAAGPARYPLRGQLLAYVDPTEPVAAGDWEALIQLASCLQSEGRMELQNCGTLVSRRP